MYVEIVCERSLGLPDCTRSVADPLRP
jgi:hypothetical protein